MRFTCYLLGSVGQTETSELARSAERNVSFQSVTSVLFEMSACDEDSHISDVLISPTIKAVETGSLDTCPGVVLADECSLYLP